MKDLNVFYVLSWVLGEVDYAIVTDESGHCSSAPVAGGRYRFGLQEGPHPAAPDPFPDFPGANDAENDLRVASGFCQMGAFLLRVY